MCKISNRGVKSHSLSATVAHDKQICSPNVYNIKANIRRVVDLSKQPSRHHEAAMQTSKGSKYRKTMISLKHPHHGPHGDVLEELQAHLQVIKKCNVFQHITSFNFPDTCPNTQGRSSPSDVSVQALTLLWALCVLQHYDLELVPSLVDYVMSPLILPRLDLQQHGSLLASLQGLSHPLLDDGGISDKGNLRSVISATTHSLSSASSALQLRHSKAGPIAHQLTAVSRESSAPSGRVKKRDSLGLDEFHTCRQALRVARGLAFQQAISPSDGISSPKLILRGKGALECSWRAAFEAATLPGLMLSDPWDLAPGAEALADMLGSPAEAYNSAGASKAGHRAYRKQESGGFSGEWLKALGDRTLELLCSGKLETPPQRRQRIPLPGRGRQISVNHPDWGDGGSKFPQPIASPVTLLHLVQIAIAAARLGCAIGNGRLSRCIEAPAGRFAAAGLWNLPPNTLADIAWALAKLGLRPMRPSVDEETATLDVGPLHTPPTESSDDSSLRVDLAECSAKENGGTDDNNPKDTSHFPQTTIVCNSTSSSSSSSSSSSGSAATVLRMEVRPCTAGPAESTGTMWIQNMLEASHQGLHCMHPTQLVRCLDALVTMGVKPYDLWLRDMELRMWYSSPVGSMETGDLVALLRCLWRIRRVPDHHTSTRMVQELTHMLPSMTSGQVASVVDSLDRLYPSGMRDRQMKALANDMRQRLAAGMFPAA